MLTFIWWMIIGVVAGILAWTLVRGRESVGLLLTLLLGLIGSLAGVIVAALVFGLDFTSRGLHPLSLTAASVGSFFVLGLYLKSINDERCHQ